MELDFRHLKMVGALAEAGSIRLAAQRLGIPQPALSRQLSRLEHSLGFLIAVRGRSGVTLTPAGEVLARHAARAAGVLADVRSELRALNVGSAPGALRIAASMPPVLTTKFLLSQGYDVSLVTAPDSRALRMVEVGEVDIALAVDHPTAPYAPPLGVALATIMDVPLWAYGITPPAGGVATVDQLADAPWLAPEPGNLRDQLEGFWRSSGVSTRVHLVGDVQSLLDAAENGAGVVFGQPLCGLFFDKGTLPVPVEGERLRERKICVWQRRSVGSSLIRGIIRVQQEIHRDLARGFRRYRDWLDGHPEALPAFSPPGP